ncbi:hypothetical protein SNE40_013375 [Patella caerulea]|uniref:Sialin n=1 Tax=Patella caerulea TaxID=87958 RepID=A0AAN8JBH2_PATCE
MDQKLEKKANQIVDTDDVKNVPCCLSQRWILAYVGFFGFICMYALRVNLSVAIVCMVKSYPENSTNGANNTNPKCDAQTSNSSSSDTEEFDWSKSEQATLLSAYFYGYLVTQMPGGWLAGRFGGKRVIGFGLIIAFLLNSLTPVASRYDIRVVTAIRVLLGLASGLMFPAMHSMWGKWAPPLERSRLTSFCYAGSFIGNIITFAASGLLCDYGFDNGWGSIFYLTSIVTVIWLVLWFIFVADTPSEHPRISAAERNYIESGIGDKQTRVLTTPWLAIAKSRAMQACLVAHFCNNWIHYTLLTGLPTFMKEVLKFDIKSNGLLSAVPYIAMTASTVLSGQAADFLRTKYFSVKVIRKFFQIMAFAGAGGCLVATGFVSCEHQMIGVVLLTLAVTFEGMCFAGYMVNQVDFAPRYAGVLFGINNAIASVPGMVAPLVVGALTPNKTQEEWRNVFYVCGGVCLLGATVFGLFARTDLEPWAAEPVEHEIEDPIKKVEDYLQNDIVIYDNKAFDKSDLKEENGSTISIKL